MTIGEFNTRCAALVKELSDMLDEFDDDSDPANIAEIIAAKYLVYYLGYNFLDRSKP